MSKFDGFGKTDAEPPIRGVATAKVTDNEDPEGLGRVKVTFPFRDTDDVSHWARVATEMASKEYGTFFLPEVGDEVLVAFEDGKITHPIVVGSLYNGKRKPPYDNGDGNNDIRAITSRNEHKLEFDDDSMMGGKVTIETAEGHTITLDDSLGSEKIKVEDKTGKNSMTMNSNKGSVTVKAKKNLTLDAQTITLNAKKKVDISAKKKVSVSGKTGVDVSGGQLKLQSNANAELKAGAMLTVKGALVKIN